MSEILNKSTRSKLEEIEINPSDNFLNGTNTSPFAVVSGTVGTVSSSANLVGSTVQAGSLIAEITTSCLTNLTTELTNIVALKTAELMKIPTDKFTEAMNKEIKEGILKNEDAIKQISVDSEDLIKEEQENLLEEQEENIKNNSAENIKKLNEKVTNALDTAKKSIDSITKTIQSGPDWVEEKLTALTNTCIGQTEKEFNQIVESFEKTKNTWAENAGKAAGKFVTSPRNQKTLQELKKRQDDIEQTKQKAKSLAKSSIAKAEMKLKGLLGG